MTLREIVEWKIKCIETLLLLDGFSKSLWKFPPCKDETYAVSYRLDSWDMGIEEKVSF